MSKNTILLITVSLIFLFAVMPVFADWALDAGEFESISAALESIPDDAGIVTLKISSLNLKENDDVLNLPAEHGITEFLILPADGAENVFLPGITRICANGIPLTIGKGVWMENASIYGGACVSEGECQLDQTSITLSGMAAFVFGGGFAENGAVSTVREPSVTVTESGSILFEAFGSGHAYGPDSRVFSENTHLQILGSADYALGCGLAEDGGQSECQQTSVTVSEGGKIPVALFSGGSAVGTGSISDVETAAAVLEGSANWAFSGDFAYGGGMTRINGYSRLDILNSGVSEIAYMGSFSSDEGSDAFVNTSELMNCGTVGQINRTGQSSDQGSEKTLIPAQFSCNAHD